MSMTRADQRGSTRTRRRLVAAQVSPLGRLGSWSYRHRRLVAVAWIVVLLVISLAGRMAGSVFKDNLNGGTSTPSQQAATFLQRNFPSQAGDTAQVVFQTTAPVTAAAARERITGTLAGLTRLPQVASVISPFAAGGAHQVSPDGHIAYGLVRFEGSGDAIADPVIQRVITRAQRAAGPGFAVQLGGAPVQKVEKPKFGKSEALGILAAVLILLLAFGSVIAMVLPIVTAIVAVATSFGLLDLLSHGVTVPSFAPELAALVGLGVGIDYSLFVVTRYRGARDAGSAPEDAVVTAMATSGRAVVFAGSTVVLSLLGLFLLGLPFIYGAALGAVIAVLVVMSASVTLLPAALGFAGANIDRLRVGRRGPGQVAAGGFWWAWSRRVQRHPWLAGGAAIGVLLVLALPFLALRLAFTDAGTNPASYTSRQAYDLIAKGFGPGTNGPLVVALSLPGTAGAGTAGGPGPVATLRADLASEADVAYVSPAQYNVNRNAAVLTVIPRTSPQDSRTSALVQYFRDTVVPRATAGTGVTALIGGQTAASIDTAGVISARLVVVVAFVIALSVLLLMAAFRSVVIPLVSAALTLLSTGAAYGVIVAVFQWGWLGGGVDNGTTAPVDPWIPLMLFALLFGFSMDYQVFLVSRIREEWRAGAVSDSDAVASGLARTGRIITSAAAIMICVFAAFVLGDLRVLRVIGLGMAVAVLLDATLVRMVATPAVLQLTGRANWWFPPALERAMPNFLAEIRPGQVNTDRADYLTMKGTS
jgi:RND superfamily putative drug exporter